MRRLTAACAVMAGLLCAAPVSAEQALTVRVEAATVDARGHHLVLDVSMSNPAEAAVFVLLSETLVYGPGQVEADCPPASAVLAGAPGLQLGSEQPANHVPTCALEPRPAGPGWRRGILRLEPGQEVALLVALTAPAPAAMVTYGVSWATADELPRRLVRRAYGAEGVFLSARAVTGPPGGGKRTARLFAHRSFSHPVSVLRRAGVQE
jgi:hypothetical protein